MRAILIEENAMVADGLVAMLKRVGLTLDVMDRSEISELCEGIYGNYNAYSAILIGGVPNPDFIIGEVRSAGIKSAAIVLAEHRDSKQSAALLRAGADDVVAKPINADELRARIEVGVRRAHGVDSSTLKIGMLTAYLDGRDPEVDGARIKLSHREHAIFSVLALNAGRVIAKETIYEAVYGLLDSEPIDKVIDVYICKLRKKIAEATGGGKYIETLFMRGYKMEAPAEHCEPADGAEVTSLEARRKAKPKTKAA